MASASSTPATTAIKKSKAEKKEYRKFVSKQKRLPVLKRGLKFYLSEITPGSGQLCLRAGYATRPITPGSTLRLDINGSWNLSKKRIFKRNEVIGTFPRVPSTNAVDDQAISFIFDHETDFNNSVDPAKANVKLVGLPGSSRLVWIALTAINANTRLVFDSYVARGVIDTSRTPAPSTLSTAFPSSSTPSSFGAGSGSSSGRVLPGA